MIFKFLDSVTANTSSNTFTIVATKCNVMVVQVVITGAANVRILGRIPGINTWGNLSDTISSSAIVEVVYLPEMRVVADGVNGTVSVFGFMDTETAPVEEPEVPPPTPFDPYSLITGTPNRFDDFNDVAVDVPINGRTMSGGVGTWISDAGWVGASNGKVMSTTNGQSAKANLTHSDCKVRMVWHPGSSGDNQVGIFARDNQSTPFIRWGYYLSTYPSYAGETPAQAIALYRVDSYTFVNISGFVPATIRRDWNVLELRCVGTTISGWLNGVKLTEIQDSLYTTARSRWGFCQTNQSNTDARIDYADFTLL